MSCYCSNSVSVRVSVSPSLKSNLMHLLSNLLSQKSKKALMLKVEWNCVK